ncbi:SDR family NAD(P)-dependent oxidoreductase [Arthrobacter sp. W4I7]|uniref:SDR family NAD(P)-dependent oxidoreductase n=1 Tax=Arthrobacter sp. W4I7 TaxID=3042296 RepID=UPI0027821838|nr:SDR family NAD(P)-dependent oxidoreductase [Arthrobacter sp. W4I7]MDQ0692812.1 hypothetical protein [Arthrobacter sp. W4I7]
MGSIDGRLALVTGATGGLAKAVAAGLAREGAAIVVVGRSIARAEEAMEGIRAQVPGATLEPLACDLSVQSSIRSAATDFLSRHERLDVLVNAAGVFRKERHVTPDGLELTFATNVMAYFLLTNLLMDALKRGAAAGSGGDARIVNVASRYGKTSLDFDDLQTAKGKYSYLRSTAAHHAGPRPPHPGVCRTASGNGGGGKRRASRSGQKHRVAGGRRRPVPLDHQHYRRPGRKGCRHRNLACRLTRNRRGVRETVGKPEGAAHARDGLGS